MSEDLRFPIGKFDSNIEVTDELRQKFINTISDLPENLNAAVKNLWETQLDTAYRPEGWTVRQVVHHIAGQSFEFVLPFQTCFDRRCADDSTVLRRPLGGTRRQQNAD